MKKLLLLISGLLLCVILLAQDIPHLISYQGKLYENENPISGAKNIEFRIGTWTELHENVQITGGLYSVTLGSITSLPSSVFENPAGLNLEVWIDGVQLTPNTSLVSVPYSYRAEISSDTKSIAGGEVSSQTPENGQILKWNGISWTPGDDEIGTVSGAAGGDLSGSFPNPTVSKILGRTVSSSTPGTGQVLKWDGSQWMPQDDNEGSLNGAAGGDLSGTYPNPMIKEGSITSAKILNGTITSTDLAFTPITNPYTGNFEATGTISTGIPSSSFGGTDIASADDLYCDDDLYVGDIIYVTDDIYLESGTNSRIYLNEGAILNFDGQNGGFVGQIYGQEGARRSLTIELSTSTSDLLINDDSDNMIMHLGQDGSLYIRGDISSSGTKHFVEDHPVDESKTIFYSSLEGGEAGTYLRGTSSLLNGEAIIDLPEHFSFVTVENGLTAQVTPKQDCNGIYVVSVSATKLVVKELMKGKSNAEFDYFVQGIRSGYEDYKVIRDKENH